MENSGDATENISILEQIDNNSEANNSVANVSSTYDNTAINGIYEYSKLNTHINLLSCTLILSTFIFLAYYLIINGGRRT